MQLNPIAPGAPSLWASRPREAAQAEISNIQVRDAVRLSGASPVLEAAPSLEPSAIPDVRGMLARNPRYSELNLEINKAYIGLANLFQDIYDPARDLHPSWYGFAPYASRQAGTTIKRAEQLTALLERGEALPSTGHPLETEMALADPDPNGAEMARFVLNLYGAQSLESAAHLVIAANRLRKLVAGQSGGLSTRLARVARTVRDMLEDGNRRIVAEIGVAGQDYLQFRQGREPSPEEVLREFHVEQAPHDPGTAGAIFANVKAAVDSNQPLVTDWGRWPAKDRPQFLVAAFAVYEAARLEPDPVKKNRWLDQAGILLAYREQHDSVHGAFQDSGNGGEVSRAQVMEMSTPFIGVPTHNVQWDFRGYANANLPPADHNPFTPRAAEYNWSDFPTRWGGILNFFGTVFGDPKTLWPMPSPNPADPV